MGRVRGGPGLWRTRARGSSRTRRAGPAIRWRAGTLLIVPEQGIGDEIRNLSCLPDVLAAAGDTARVLVGCDDAGSPNLIAARLSVGRSGGAGRPDGCVERRVDTPRLRFRACSGAHRMRSPMRPATSRADPERVARHRRVPARIAPPGPRIGLAWRSGSRRLRSAAALTDIEAWDGVSGDSRRVFHQSAIQRRTRRAGGTSTGLSARILI
jgi:hypothetical protein